MICYVTGYSPFSDPYVLWHQRRGVTTFCLPSPLAGAGYDMAYVSVHTLYILKICIRYSGLHTHLSVRFVSVMVSFRNGTRYDICFLQILFMLYDQHFTNLDIPFILCTFCFDYDFVYYVLRFTYSVHIPYGPPFFVGCVFMPRRYR